MLFFRLGCTSFGGPAAHIAMLEDEVVRRRKWLTRTEFLDLFGVTQLIPGPNSTEMAIHIGFRRAGWTGLVVAGVGFIFPATVIVSGIAWAYVEFGHLPDVTAILYGVKPVICAILLQAIVGFSKTAVHSIQLGILFLASILGYAFGTNELILLLFAGAGSIVMSYPWPSDPGKNLAIGLSLGAGSFIPAKAMAESVVSTNGATFGAIFYFFLKIGSMLFGSGYVLLAFVRTGIVERLGWITEAQLIDAAAVGQVTPGPVFTAATFIGYLLSGFPGAVAATFGIFLPAFVFVALTAPYVSRLRESVIMGRFLDGVNVASLGLLVVVSTQLAKASVTEIPAIVIFGIAVYALMKRRIHTVWLILMGCVAGWIAMAYPMHTWSWKL